MTMPNDFSVFKYHNYRDFLNSYVDISKSLNPRWNLSSWARQMGIIKVTSLNVILTGQRRIGAKSLDKIIRFFRFSQEEEAYFRLLVRREEMRDDKVVQEMIDEEIRYKSYKPKKKLLDNTQFTYISDWYHLAIHQMAHICPLKDDPQWIQKYLRRTVPISDIKDAIENLVNLRILVRENNLLKLAVESLHTLQDVPSKAIRRHHSDMMDNAKEALSSVHVEEREFRGKTLAISTKQIPLAKELVRKFIRQFGLKLGYDKGNAVYQLNIQFFPLSEKIEETD
jgi:uncharacterized protein (TIGR02147 family)